MQKKTQDKSILRIIDANINRAKEGLRVCEEITRFILNNRKLTTEFKKTRHQINSIVSELPLRRSEVLAARNSLEDIGEDIYINEFKRKNVCDVFFANMQRIKESVRVLEEFGKLIDKNSALKFKSVRYAVYEIEKEAAKRISALYNT